jgi:hypothetical protein
MASTKVFTALTNGMTWLLRFAVFLLALLVFLPLLPILMLGFAIAWIRGQADTWRYRRGFDARFRPKGKKAVFVYSDSPHWKERIESKVLPMISDQAVVLNWSERSTLRWKQRPLDVRIFEHWGGSLEFNPVAIVLPAEGPVEVIRFWQAYKDYRHGNPRLLREKEQELFDALGIPLEERPEVRAE